MKRPVLFLIGVLGAFALCACSPKAGATASDPSTLTKATSTFSDASTSEEIHSSLLTPGSDTLFAAESEAPGDAKGWAAVQEAATKVVEGAQLLQIGSRPAGSPEWIRIAKAFEDAARRSGDAVRARNLDALAVADGDFTAQCEDCHNIFRDAGHGMMSSPDK